MAIDHTHDFTWGAALGRRRANMDSAVSREFVSLLERAEVDAAATRPGEMRYPVAEVIVARVPGEWEVEQAVRIAWSTFIADRAAFLAANLAGWLWPQGG
jgi:hypothetical protein